jgi:hypothetical protein
VRWIMGCFAALSRNGKERGGVVADVCSGVASNRRPNAKCAGENRQVAVQTEVLHVRALAIEPAAGLSKGAWVLGPFSIVRYRPVCEDDPEPALRQGLV